MSTALYLSTLNRLQRREQRLLAQLREPPRTNAEILRAARERLEQLPANTVLLLAEPECPSHDGGAV